jgi:NAD(P)-dependent dehydrogenase (short-subunit alcohol dehydrogenase family)
VLSRARRGPAAAGQQATPTVNFLPTPTVEALFEEHRPLTFNQMAKKILVTGANKGIGYAIAKALLDQGCFVYLGSRDSGRGAAALKSLVDAKPEHASMAEVVPLDVTDEASVAAASAHIKAQGQLDVLINNAGGSASPGLNFTNVTDHEQTIELNFFGAVRVTEAMLPIMPEGGRIVMLSSGAAPTFVSKCSPEKKAFFCKPDATRAEISAVLDEIKAIGAKAADADAATSAFEAAGFGSGSSYGLSKAVLNLYTMLIARENPKLSVNACTPGFVETDLTRHFADKYGKTPAEMGMISTEQGARSALFCAVGDVPTPAGKGYYYGSDSLRSPLDSLRNPGTAAHEGE